DEASPRQRTPGTIQAIPRRCMAFALSVRSLARRAVRRALRRYITAAGQVGENRHRGVDDPPGQPPPAEGQRDQAVRQPADPGPLPGAEPDRPRRPAQRHGDERYAILIDDRSCPVGRIGLLLSVRLVYRM